MFRPRHSHQHRKLTILLALKNKTKIALFTLITVPWQSKFLKISRIVYVFAFILVIRLYYIFQRYVKKYMNYVNLFSRVLFLSGGLAPRTPRGGSAKDSASGSRRAFVTVCRLTQTELLLIGISKNSMWCTCALASQYSILIRRVKSLIYHTLACGKSSFPHGVLK